MEEDFKPILCVICFNVKSAEDCTVIDESVRNALDVLLLKPVEEANMSTICNACYTKVFEAFRFKLNCMDTEDSILPHFNSKNGAPIDLKDIYLMKKGNELLISVSEAERICRLCMQIVCSGFTSVKDIEFDAIRIYIPEVNFNATEEPVVCMDCLESLTKHSGFLRNCLGVQKLENVCEDDAIETQVDIKTEEIEIKSEEGNEDTETLYLAEDPVACETQGGLHSRLSEEAKHKCSICGYQSNVKSNLTRHQLKHKDLSEVPTYKCDMCDYITKRKGHLASHQLIHKEFCEVQIYKCDKCSYKSKYKSHFVKHQLLHKDISEVQMYKCDVCNFETKHRKSLVGHELRHKDNSEVQMYTCDACCYKTKFKADLVKHQLIHKHISEVQMYKCGTCNFETKHKKSLKGHIHKHRHPSNAQ